MGRYKKSLLLLLAMAMCVAALPAQSAGSDQIRQAITTFGKGQYDESLRLFRNIILDSSLTRLHGDSYFWISKSYMALGQYDNASKNLEFFLGEYPDNRNYAEGLYQRGRLVFLQGEYEIAIQVLEDFLESHGDSPYAANSYFWIGESLYTLGHFDSALEIFETVVDSYPTSFKVEAARYRVSLIELKERERELLKLLKWSHEEYLRALEDFDRKERSYEQALISYQRTIRDFDGGGTEDPQVAILESQLVALQKELADYKQRLATASSVSPVTVVEAPKSQTDLLALKEQALELKSFYLLWLAALQ